MTSQAVQAINSNGFFLPITEDKIIDGRPLNETERRGAEFNVTYPCHSESLLTRYSALSLKRLRTLQSGTNLGLSLLTTAITY